MVTCGFGRRLPFLGRTDWEETKGKNFRLKISDCGKSKRKVPSVFHQFVYELAFLRWAVLKLPATAGPFDGAHGLEQVEEASRKGMSFIFCP